MSENMFHPDTEAAKAAGVDKREDDSSRVVDQMRIVLDAFEAVGEPVIAHEEIFDDMLPDENGNPYVGMRRWTRIGAGARTDTDNFSTFIPSYLDISLSQPDDESMQERYAGGVATIQYFPDSHEMRTLNLYVRSGKLRSKELVIKRTGAEQVTQELGDGEAPKVLQDGLTHITYELVEFAASTHDEAGAEQAVNIVKQLIKRGALDESDLDRDTWLALSELYSEDGA